MTRRPTLYSVTFTHAVTGAVEFSRVCQTIRAARKWAAWLASKDFARDVTVWRGQPGGERVQVGGAV